MLRVNNAHTSTIKAEGSTETAWKSEGIEGIGNKVCKVREHNHTCPEHVWGDEGPVNERRGIS
jgi:hypothetical protein